MKKKPALLFLLSVVLCLSIFALPSIACANVFVGGLMNNISPTGVQCNIYTATYGVPSAGHMTCVWPMVDQDANNFAQVGWAVEQVTGIQLCHYFWAYMSGGGYHEVDSSAGPAYNSWHTYKVVKSGSSWIGYEDSAQIGSANFTLTPTNAEYFNENDSSSTQYIGTHTSKLEFSQVSYLSGSNWVKPSLSFSNGTNSSIDYSNWSSGGYWYS